MLCSLKHSASYQSPNDPKAIPVIGLFKSSAWNNNSPVMHIRNERCTILVARILR